MIISTKEIAIILGVTRRAIGQMVERGMPKQALGQFDVKECIDWIIESRSKNRAATDLEGQRCFLLKEQTEACALQNAQRRAELVGKQDVLNLMDEITSALEGVHVGIGERLAPNLAGLRDPGATQAILDSEMHQIRITLSEVFESWVEAAKD